MHHTAYDGRRWAEDIAHAVVGAGRGGRGVVPCRSRRFPCYITPAEVCVTKIES